MKVSTLGHLDDEELPHLSRDARAGTPHLRLGAARALTSCRWVGRRERERTSCFDARRLALVDELCA